MNKKEIKDRDRLKIKEIWKGIDSENKRLWDKRVFENAFLIPEYASSRVVFCFVSMDNEPDTISIINRILEDKKTLCVPKCTGKGLMKALKITSLNDLKKGKYGILEPSLNCEEINAEDIDLAFVPCVSADRNLNRLGHGGGYYDRFMEKGSFKKVLISYERLLLDEVTTDIFDVPCDYLVTEEKIYKR